MLRAFFLPLSITLAMHAVVLALLFWGLPGSSEQLRARPLPQFVQAKLVVLEPKAPPKPAVAPKPAPEPKPEPKAEPKPDPQKLERERKAAEAKKREAERQRKEAERKRKETERKQQEAERKRKEAERQQEERRRLDQQQQQELQRALAQEEAAMQAATDAETASSYSAVIQQAVARQWSRPPSARNEMVVELQIRMLPTGEVVSVQVVSSSGNLAFDRSAEQAVKKASPIAEIKDLSRSNPRVFEQYFRSFRMRFSPEDLRR